MPLVRDESLVLQALSLDDVARPAEGLLHQCEDTLACRLPVIRCLDGDPGSSPQHVVEVAGALMRAGVDDLQHQRRVSHTP